MYARYDREKADWCLGCGDMIRAGDGCMAFDEYWLLCEECAEQQPDTGRSASPWSPAVPQRDAA